MTDLQRMTALAEARQAEIEKLKKIASDRAEVTSALYRSYENDAVRLTRELMEAKDRAAALDLQNQELQSRVTFLKDQHSEDTQEKDGLRSEIRDLEAKVKDRDFQVKDLLRYCGHINPCNYVTNAEPFECTCGLDKLKGLERPKSEERCRMCWSDDGGRAWIHIGVPVRACGCDCHQPKSELAVCDKCGRVRLWGPRCPCEGSEKAKDHKFSCESRNGADCDCRVKRVSGNEKSEGGS